MKSSLDRDALSGKLVRAVFYTHCAMPFGFAIKPVLAAETVTLPVISVTTQEAGTLKAPAATGSNLDLTPFQTPASVDVITRAQLEERGDTSLVDAITRAAGISGMGHPGNSGSSLSARGFTDTTSVMRLYDGTRQYGGVGVSFPFDTWSVDRIEVLRGPASVIYGDGAIGGVVNIIPKKPTRGAIQHEIQATIGTDNTQRLGYGSGGAINDKLSYRVDISGDRSDGWVDMGDSHNLTFSGALQLDVSADFRLKLSYAQGRQEPMRYFGTPLVNGVQLEALREKNYNVSDSKIQYDDRWTELATEWTPNADTTVRSKLYYIASKRHWRNAEKYEYKNGLIDRSDDTEILHDQTQIGNTTDATFRGHLFGLKNQVSVGFDISSSSFQHRNNTYVGIPTPASVDPYNPVAGNFVSAIPTVPRYRNKAEQYSVFAENRLELTDAWSVLAGLRYDHADISRTELAAGNPSFDKKYSNVGWRLGTVYEIQPDLAIYGQYSKAADPVGGLLMISAANSKFDLSTGKQIEVGVKQAFWNRKGEWTLAAYSIQKNNLRTRDINNPALVVQVGEQSSKGIEATLALAFAPGWQLDANATILRAKYDDFMDPVGSPATATVSRAGNVPPNVAERLANVWLSWNFIPDWTASTGLRYVGKRYADNANTLTMPAYTATDLALQWKASRNTTLTLRGFNVFDQQYFTTAYYNPTQWFNGPGRRIELTANHRF